MPIAEIASRQIGIGLQSALGTLALNSAGKLQNFRPSTSGGLKKEAFTSDSIRTDQQRSTPRHGMRSAEFNLDQELQSGGHQALMGAALRSAWAAITSTALTTIAINATTRTISRVSGSFLTDGFRVGDIVRATGFVATVNNGKNLRLATVTALAMTYIADTWLPALTTETAGASVTITVPGKKAQVPASGHSKNYFTIDDWHPDITNQTTIKDAVVNTMAIDVAPGAHASIAFGFLGTDAAPTGTAVYFSSSPTAAPTGALLAGPNGLLRYNGVDSAVVQSLQISLDSGAEVKGVIGANKSPDVFRDAVTVTGSLSALFDNSVAILTAFDAETSAPLYLYLFADSSAASEFVIIKLPSVKPMGADKSVDGPALQISSDLAMGKLASSTDQETTVICIVDSLAV
jgi:hypothetical protein